MELTRKQQQYILDVLAELCGKQMGAEITFTLEEPDPAESAE